MYPIFRIGGIYARPAYLIRTYVHKLPQDAVAPELRKMLKGKTAVIDGVGYLTLPLTTLYESYPSTLSLKAYGDDPSFGKYCQVRDIIGRLTVGLRDELIDKVGMNVQSLIVDLPLDGVFDVLRARLHAFDNALRVHKDPDKTLEAVKQAREALDELPYLEGSVCQTLLDIKATLNDVELVTHFMR